MSQHRKHRGYASQRIVADYLQANGFPHAEPVGAGRPGSDVTGTPGIDWEVKARRRLSLTELIEQQLDRDNGCVPVGVIRPDGWGPARIAVWPTVMPLGMQVALLRAAGYGNPLEGGAA